MTDRVLDQVFVSRRHDRDVNGDGAGDLVVVAGDGYLYYYPNNVNVDPQRAPFHDAAWKSPNPSWGDVVAMTAGDISGDGVADLMVVAGDGYLYYYPNNINVDPQRTPFHDAAWKSPNPSWGAVKQISATDISADGVADLMVVAGDGYLYYYPNNINVDPQRTPFHDAAWKSPNPSWRNARLG